MCFYNRLTLLAAFAAAACTNSTPIGMDEMSTSVRSELATLQERHGNQEIAAVDLSQGMLAAVRGAAIASERYKASSAQASEAVFLIQAAQSSRRPQITTTVRGGGMDEVDRGNRSFRGVYGNLALSQLLSDGGASVAAIDAATANAIASNAALYREVNEIAVEAGAAWVDLWLSHERVDLLERRSGDIDTLLSQIERMAANGMVDNATVDSAKRQLVEINLERQRLIQQRTAAEINFKRFFVELPTDRISVENIPNALIEEAIDLWSFSPDLQETAAMLVVARAELERRQAAFRPSTSLQANFNSPLDENDASNVTVGLVLEYTISSGGRREAEANAAQARVEAANSALQEAYQLAHSLAENTRSQLHASVASLSLISERVALSAAEVEAARSQLVTGQTSLRELIDAEISAFRAQDMELEALADLIKLKLSALAQVGNLVSPIDEAE